MTTEVTSSLVCRHLVVGRDLGFHYARNRADPDEHCPAAWCDACDGVVSDRGAWTERALAFAEFATLCDDDYDDARRRNWRQDEAAFEELLRRSVSYLERQQSRIQKRFPRAKYDRMAFDNRGSEVVFATGGRPHLVAGVQVVGTLWLENRSWLWCWANPAFDEAVKRAARAVRAHGEERGFRDLASALWIGDETDAWNMTAVTAALVRAEGAIRAPTDGFVTFMVVTGARWVS